MARYSCPLPDIPALEAEQEVCRSALSPRASYEQRCTAVRNWQWVPASENQPYEATLGRETWLRLRWRGNRELRGADEAPCCSTATRRAAVIKRWQPHAVPADSDVFPWFLHCYSDGIRSPLGWRVTRGGSRGHRGSERRGSRSRGDDGVKPPRAARRLARGESPVVVVRISVRVLVRVPVRPLLL